MGHRVNLDWPDAAPFRERNGAPIRLLAVSDALDDCLCDARNRKALGPIDLVVGCGDLAAHDLCFIADAIDAPLVYIRGNHDGDERWAADSAFLPDAVRSASVVRASGLALVGLGWPGHTGRGAQRSERGAWHQAIDLAARRIGRHEPLLLFSHVPPQGVGDIATDAYHRGFHGYRWILEHIRPPLWLHGHTPLAGVVDWKAHHGSTAVVNATGSVVVELWPPGSGKREAFGD